MKRNVWVGLLGLALGLILAACGSQGTGPDRAGLGATASGPLVDPIPYIPWRAGDAQTECTRLGIPFDGAFKVDPPISGTYSLDAFGNTVTVTFSDDGRFVSFSATLPISAVIVKGGPNANAYIYNPPVTADSNLRSPDHPGPGQIPRISHVTFCWEYRLTVAKTARTTYTRQFFWEIQKTGDRTDLVLSAGQVFPVNYTVQVRVARQEDRDFAVSGNIVITNNTPLTFVVQSVQDVVSPDIAASVNCGTLPHTLGPGASLTCTYTASLPDKSDRTNTATVTYRREGEDRDRTATATAPVTFGDPTTLVDDQVTVTDDRYGPLGTVSHSEAPRTFTYVLNVGPYPCGPEDQYYAFTNTAAFTTNTTGTTASSSWTVNVRVPACPVGCTLTQGYWKTHTKYGPAKHRDDTWDQILPDGEDTIFYLSGQTYYQVLWTPPAGGNPYYQLAHQYIAALLNKLNGAATTPEVEAALAWADNFFRTYAPNASLSRTLVSQARNYAGILGRYNEGQIGPGHCSER
jgi:hypothetical protein